MSILRISTKHSKREKKRKVVEELKGYLRTYKVFALADLVGLRTRELQAIRRKLYGKAVIKVAKNTLMRRAIEEVFGKEAEKIVPYLTGQNAFLFADMNPFELYEFLEENKVESEAKPGDVAPDDIYVPEGNTGMPPGPILSKFGKLKIPTRIEEGSIFIVKDTLVAKKGEVISTDLAEILSKLGIKPMKIGLSIKLVYFEGRILKPEDLKIDYEKMISEISEAYRGALALSLNAVILTAESTPILLKEAHTKAFTLSIFLGVVTPENVVYVVRLAHQRALLLAVEAAIPDPELIKIAISAAYNRAKHLEQLIKRQS